VYTVKTATSFRYIPRVHLPDVGPAVFESFLKYIYSIPLQSHNNVTATFGEDLFAIVSPDDNIPLSFKAWSLGSTLKSHVFQNFVLHYIHTSLGRTFKITPSLVSWIYDQKVPVVQIKMWTNDALATYWAQSTGEVDISPGSTTAWEQLLASKPDIRRDFLLACETRKMKPETAYYIPSYHSPYSSGAQGGSGTHEKAVGHGTLAVQMHPTTQRYPEVQGRPAARTQLYGGGPVYREQIKQEQVEEKEKSSQEGDVVIKEEQA
jgi:hypothetical protein